MNHRHNAYRLTMRSLFIALIIMQSFIPLFGYIPLGVINLTIIQITVIIASITLGPKDGMFVGLTWGIVKLIIAYTMPSSLMDTLVFRNPIITIIPRVIIGFTAGWSFYFLYRWTHRLSISTIITAAIGSLTNTIGVLSFMFLFAPQATAKAYQIGQNILFKTLMTIAGTNGIPECIASVILVPLIVRAIFKYTHLKPLEYQ